MNILAINSSPRNEGQSKTELMLNHLVEGMRDAGAEVEVVNLRQKNIKNCVGCFSCWSKTPGRCVHQDDMTKEIFPKWLAADLAVYATPLYYNAMNGAMAIFKERTLPASQPFFALDDCGKTYHPLRHKVPSAVWLSVCGFPEASEFDALSDYLNQTRHKDVPLVAEIYRSAAETMTNPVFKEKLSDILGATTQAGRELVTSKQVLPETMARIEQPLLDSQLFTAMGNLIWKTCIAEKVTPKTFREQKIVPRPDTLKEFLLLFPCVLDPETVGEKKVVLQFDFSGQVEDSCHFSIEAGQIDAKQGAGDTPDVTIGTPFEVWMDIMTRKADGQQLFMERQYQVKGDISLMMQLFAQNTDA